MSAASHIDLCKGAVGNGGRRAHPTMQRADRHAADPFSGRDHEFSSAAITSAPARVDRSGPAVLPLPDTQGGRPSLRGGSGASRGLAGGAVRTIAGMTRRGRRRLFSFRQSCALSTGNVLVHVGGVATGPTVIATRGRNFVASGHEPASQAVRDSAEALPVVGVVFHPPRMEHEHGQAADKEW